MLETGDVLLMTDKVPTIYHAWNLGIRASNCEYVTNANSDDLLAVDGIARLADYLDKSPSAAVTYPDVDIVQSLEGGFVDAKRTGAFRFAEGGFEELMQVCFVGPMPMWRRSLHEKHGWFDAKMQSAGDYEMWLRLAKAGEKFLHVREVLGIYLDRPDSAGHRDMEVVERETSGARKRYAENRKTVYAKIGA
jgi:GT2 family glycosyltransferase